MTTNIKNLTLEELEFICRSIDAVCGQRFVQIFLNEFWARMSSGG